MPTVDPLYALGRLALKNPVSVDLEDMPLARKNMISKWCRDNLGYYADSDWIIVVENEYAPHRHGTRFFVEEEDRPLFILRWC